jgi:hypothetical protein
MPDLSRELRRSLEATVKAAREAAETGAAASLRRLGVDAADLPAHLEPRRAERNRLRAHARSLGDRLAGNGTHEIRRLTEAAAYVQWHRLLFARFLLERGLLRDETGVAVWGSGLKPSEFLKVFEIRSVAETWLGAETITVDLAPAAAYIS